MIRCGASFTREIGYRTISSLLFIVEIEIPLHNMSGDSTNVVDDFCVIQLSGVIARSNKRKILKAAKLKSVNGWTAPARSYRPVWMSMNRITNQKNVSVGLPSPCLLSRIRGNTCGIGYYHTKRVVASSEPQTHQKKEKPNRDTLGSKDIRNTDYRRPWDVTAIKKYIIQERAQSDHSNEGNGNKPNQVVKDYNLSRHGTDAGDSKGLNAGSQVGVKDKDECQVVREVLKDDKKSGIYHNLIDIITDVRFMVGCYNEIKGKPGNMTNPHSGYTSTRQADGYVQPGCSPLWWTQGNTPEGDSRRCSASLAGSEKVPACVSMLARQSTLAGDPSTYRDDEGSLRDRSHTCVWKGKKKETLDGISHSWLERLSTNLLLKK